MRAARSSRKDWDAGRVSQELIRQNRAKQRAFGNRGPVCQRAKLDHPRPDRWNAKRSLLAKGTRRGQATACIFTVPLKPLGVQPRTS